MMKNITLASAALLASAGVAGAAGIERSNQSMAILFEEGTYLEFGYTFVDPELSGSLVAAPAVNSGDISPSYNTFDFAYRQDITDNLSVALTYGNHIGADVDYVPGGTVYPFNAVTGSQAELQGDAVTTVLRYEFPSNFSVYGGARFSQISGEVSLFNGYTLTTQNSAAWGYLLGVAYERPEIALRVSLTYNSEIEHSLNAFEAGLFPTQFETTIPQSWHLEFQSGIAEDTLIFGSVRWVEWTAFDVTPDVFSDGVPDGLFGGNSLVSYGSDYTTYTLGIGRRFNDNWSGRVQLTHEPSSGDLTGNLGPSDGLTAIGLGVRYQNEGYSISGGVQYGWIGDATSRAPLPAPPGTPLGSFTDNTYIAAGIRFGIHF